MSIFLQEYDYATAKQWCVEHEGFLLKSVAVYVVAIFSIKYVMRDRRPFDLQQPLILWNAFLALFSLLGFLFVTPTFLSIIINHGISHTYTHITDLQKGKVAGYWTFLWVVSKIPEFVDTFFIVLRKKPLMFMHWYHHALTGWFAFVNFYEDNAYMIWVVWLNYFIHFCMYSYYMLRAMHIRVHPKIAQIITLSQMIQFCITIVAMAHVVLLSITTNKPLAFTPRGIAVGAFMMITYLILWLRFYYISYISAGGKKYNAFKETAKDVKAQ